MNFNHNPQSANINSPGYFANYFSEEFNKHDFGQFEVPDLMTDNSHYQNMQGNQARQNDVLSDSNSSTNHSSKHSPEYLEYTDNHSALDVRDETDIAGHSKVPQILRKGIQKQYEAIMDNNIEYRYEDDPNEYKKARKRIQNRESASRVRSKKKTYVGDLESEMAVVKQENTELRVENAALRAENNLLKQQTCFLERMAMKNGQQQPPIMTNAPPPVLTRQQSFEECLLPLVNNQQTNSKKFGYIRAASPHTFKKHAVILGVFTALLCVYGVVPQGNDKSDLLYAGNINEFRNSFSMGVKSVNVDGVGRAGVPGHHMDLDQSLTAMIKMNQEYNFVKSVTKWTVILGIDKQGKSMNNPTLLNRVIENLYLATTWISALTCLIRTDYNFTFALFGYYYWVTKRTTLERTKILMGVSGVLIIFDILWLVTAGSSWTQKFDNTPIWNSTHGLRVFAIVMSSINILTKILTIVSLFLLDKLVRRNPDLEIAPLGGADYLEQNKPYGADYGVSGSVGMKR